jgi:hypothetical protein
MNVCVRPFLMHALCPPLVGLIHFTYSCGYLKNKTTELALLQKPALLG